VLIFVENCSDCLIVECFIGRTLQIVARIAFTNCRRAELLARETDTIELEAATLLAVATRLL
jgi:hypothetical protein